MKCRGFVVLLATMLLGSGVGTAHANFSSWGSSGTGDGQFLFPSGVAVAPNGSVYVTEGNEANARVQRFTADGGFLGKFGSAGTGPGQFKQAFCVAVAPDGRVYVLDNYQGNIQRFSAGGTYEASWSAGANPGEFAIGPAEEFYVVIHATGSDSVAKYTANGDFVTSWPAGSPFQVNDVAVDAAGNVYVLDLPSGGESGPVGPLKARKFSSSGTLLDEWVVAAPAPVFGAGYLAIGPSGALYIQSGLRLMRFSPTGQFVGELTLPAEGIGTESVYYRGLVAKGDFVYLAHVGGRRIRRLDVRTPTPSVDGPGRALTGIPVSFDASASSVPLGRIANYQWDLDGNGGFELNTGASPTATHTYTARGAVDVGVQVTSDLGGVRTTTEHLDVLPSPPPGPVGVSINGGDQYTNSPKVKVRVRWPRYASDLVLSNDGGFDPFDQRPLEETIAWRLRSSGPERLPKTIYVRFIGGDSGPETYQDDIILDQTAPKVDSATIEGAPGAPTPLARRAKPTMKLRLVARDRVSGIGKMQITSKKAKPGKWKRFRPRVRLAVSSRPVFVRVRDRAGNKSRWLRASLKD